MATTFLLTIKLALLGAKKVNANLFWTKFLSNPSGHGCPRRKSWTSAPKSAFSCAPGGGEKLLDAWAFGRITVRVRNARGKSGPKSLCLCGFFFPELLNFIVVAFPTKKTFLDDFPLSAPKAHPPQKRKFYFYCRLAVSDTGHRAIPKIARYVAKWGIAQMCLCEAKYQGEISPCWGRCKLPCKGIARYGVL